MSWHQRLSQLQKIQLQRASTITLATFTITCALELAKNIKDDENNATQCCEKISKTRIAPPLYTEIFQAKYDEKEQSLGNTIDTQMVKVQSKWNIAKNKTLCDSDIPLDQQYSSAPSLSHTPPPPPLSRTRRIFAKIGLLPTSWYPTPRYLTPNDPCFEYCGNAMRRRQQRDEVLLRALETEALEARRTADPHRVAEVVRKASVLAYGEGVTPQMRQDFLIKYGCAAFDDGILSMIHDLAKTRGVIEIGAGNGQWARALSDFHETTKALGLNGSSSPKPQPPHGPPTGSFEFVLAYDDASSLPLDPAMYHPGTVAHAQHFYSRVRQAGFESALRSWEARGRVLLLVFPPPGSMAVQCVKEYVAVDPIRNDTLVYVGEGRGGANANDEFFDYLLAGGWVLLEERQLEKLGDKGFEKLFVLKRYGEEV